MMNDLYKPAVPLREVLESEAMGAVKSVLAVALGKDDSGNPVTGDLERMLHLLVSGQVGSGKSACLHAIIVSLISRADPDEVRLLLLDPRGVEMKPYEGVPHLVMPVVTGAEKAAEALQWAVTQLVKRFDRLRRSSAVNIDDYNRKARENGAEQMARIVIVIDEVWDILRVYGNDAEADLGRLTQFGHAAGIYAVVSTQVPSFLRITSHVRSRIAFRLPNAIESRAALGLEGAENLDRFGEMLYLPVSSIEPEKVRCCYADSEEIVRAAERAKDAAGGKGSV